MFGSVSQLSFQLGTPWAWRAGGTGTAGSVSFQVSPGRVELEPQAERNSWLGGIFLGGYGFFHPQKKQITSVWNLPETLETWVFLDVWDL